MKTSNVIAAGIAQAPAHVAGAVSGFSNGTWADPPGLGPGDSYDITAYDPDPTPAQLSAAGTDYPGVLLPAYLSLEVPRRDAQVVHPGAPPAPALTQAVFAPFGSTAAAAYGRVDAPLTAAIYDSPYARAYTLARSLLRGASTPYDYVLRVQRYLSTTNGFVYDEHPAPSRYPLESFLFSTHRGYCQQFAGAMTMLLRMGGVPARVATGFTTGSYDAATHSYVVTDLDAHAWVEGWFPGYGWVRFDPTPATAPARGGKLPQQPIKSLLGPTVPNGPAGGGLKNAGGAGGAPVASHHGGTSVLPLIGLGVAVLALALALRVIVRVGEPTAESLLAELERAFARCRRPLAPQTTLAELERRLRVDPAAQAYVRTLRLSRFGGAGLAAPPGGRRAVRAHLRRGLGPLGRLRAAWALPPLIRVGRIGRIARARRLHST